MELYFESRHDAIYVANAIAENFKKCGKCLVSDLVDILHSYRPHTVGASMLLEWHGQYSSSIGWYDPDECYHIKPCWNISSKYCFDDDRSEMFICSTWKLILPDPKEPKKEEETMTRKDILKDAEHCVCGHREEDYGSPEDNFKLIADLWSGYLKTTVTPVDVAMMMGLLKIARVKGGRMTADSFVDLAGYAACGGEIADKMKNKEE